MSPLRLNGSSSGYTEVTAPATAANNTLTLPTSNGTSGQVLTTNGSGALSWTAPATVTVANEATDTTCFPLFSTAATGDLGPKSNAGLTFNSATGALSVPDASITQIFRVPLYGAALNNTYSVSGDGQGLVIKAREAATPAGHRFSDIVALGSVGGGGSQLRFFTNTSDTAVEAMRIDNSGRLLVGASSPAGGTDGQLYVQQDAVSVRNIIALNNTAAGSTAGGICAFYRSGTFTGGITNTASSTAFNTSSDYRLKENIVPLTGAVDRVNQLQVRRFNFIADPDTTVDGFIAHEAQAVVPECVTGEKDAADDDGNPIYQGIDQSKLVPLLTAALQEALTRIETLETRLTALEAQP